MLKTQTSQNIVMRIARNKSSDEQLTVVQDLKKVRRLVSDKPAVDPWMGGGRDARDISVQILSFHTVYAK